MGRKFIAATITSCVLALSLQFGGFARAHPASTLLVADQSSGSSQNEGRSGQRDAESNGKMQSNKDTHSSGGKVDPMDPPSNPSSGSNLRMQQNSGGTPTNPESSRTLEGSSNPFSESVVGKTIKGEVLRVEGNDCVIMGQDGREVRLQVDITTLKARNIEPGDRIEATVNDQNDVLSIHSAPTVMDRRNDKK